MSEHVVGWAELILNHFDHVNKEEEYIFENQQELSQWEHARELVNNAKQIKVGNFRFSPSNLHFCYSQ